MSKAVFFDRDGTLNFDDGYTHKPDELKFIQGAMDAVKYSTDNGYLAIVITNQSGIGRGFYTKNQMDLFHATMNQALIKHGTQISQFYHCPHLPSDNCACRKPNTALVKQAILDYDLQAQDCFFIGDKLSDEQCAQKIGIKFSYYKTGSLYEVVRQLF